MAIKYLAANRIEGLTTDTKPTAVPTGSRFFESDANYGEWYFDGSTWIQRLSLENDIFYDGFDSTFTFTNGGLSPNGKWKNKFIGTGTGGSTGSSGVRVSSGGLLNGQTVLWQVPGAVTVSTDTSSVVNYTVNNTYQDFELTCKMRTISQTRTGSAPNNWETAWIIWRIGDIGGQMGYYFTIKMSGSEFGKSDNKEGSVANYILATPGSPSVTLGQWYAVKVRVQGNRHQVWTDTTGAGTNYTLTIDYTDINAVFAPSPSRQIQRGGYISFYCEDSQVEFSDIRVMPIYPRSILDYEQSVYNTVPLPSSNRKFGAWYAVGAVTADGLLSGALTQPASSTNAQVIDDLGIHWTYTTGAVSGNQAGLLTNAAIFRRTHNPVLRVKFMSPATTTNSQMLVGFSSASSLATTTTPLNNLHGVLVGWRNGDTTWNVLSNNGSATQTVTAEGQTVAASQWNNVEIELQSSFQCTVRVNNRTPITLTTTAAKPAVSTNLYVYCVLTTLTTAAKTFSINNMDIEMSPGVDQ